MKTKKRNPKIRTSMNFSLQLDVLGDVEHPVGVSMTVPGQVMSLEQLIKRSSQGLLPLGQRPQYSDDDDLPEFYKMDQLELIQYRIDLAEDMEKMRQQLHDASKALEAKQADERKKDAEELERLRKTSVTQTAPDGAQSHNTP